MFRSCCQPEKKYVDLTKANFSFTPPSTNKLGFTLVELSIVLVILGLLVGGVLAGQSLIAATQLRAVTVEYTNYKTALGAFREKYSALPGDMSNAVKFWGAAGGGMADGVDAACNAVTTPATGTETCNGNGDGLLPEKNYGTDFDEYFRLWQHLSNAGLVEGSYSGVTGSGSDFHAVIGTNVPASKLGRGAGWSMFYADISSPWMYPVNFGNFLYLGAAWPNEMNFTDVLKAEEAYNIDTKLDDGMPQSGKVMAHPAATRPNCVNGSDDGYLLSDTTFGCPLIFKTGY